MDSNHFSTPEDVELQYELAGPASRFGAFAYDRFLLMLLQIGLLLIGLLLALFARSLTGFEVPTGESFFLVIVTILVGFGEFLYFGLHEWRSNGLTPGKKKLGMKVTMDGGYSLTPTAVILRTLLRVVDTIPLFWIIPVLDKKTRRLGDFVGGTLVLKVVQEDNTFVPLANMDHATLAVRHLQLGTAQLSKLQRSQYSTIEEFLSRARQMGKRQRSSLAKQIVGALMAKMEVELPTGVDSFELLKEIYLAMRKHANLLSED